jgi:Middle or third domain of peptidase_M16
LDLAPLGCCSPTCVCCAMVVRSCSALFHTKSPAFPSHFYFHKCSLCITLPIQSSMRPGLPCNGTCTLHTSAVGFNSKPSVAPQALLPNHHAQHTSPCTCACIAQEPDRFPPAGPQRWVWEELRDISAMKFRFQEEEEPCDTVTRLASCLGWVPPHHVLCADYLHEKWTPDQVSGAVSNTCDDASYVRQQCTQPGWSRCLWMPSTL